MSQHHLILRIVSKVLLPFILLYGFYVQFHGDFGPGGGFQAGVIFAVGIILYALVFGLEDAQKVAPPGVIQILMAIGVLLYAGVGVATMLLGGNFLAYDVLHPDLAHHTGQHYGILLVELGVGITVAAVMINLFYSFAGRNVDIDDEEW